MAISGRSRRNFRNSLRTLLLGQQGAKLRDDLATEADDRLKRSRIPRPQYPSNTWASVSDYWPTDGSWQPSPEVVDLISDRRYQQSFGELKESFQRHPIRVSDSQADYL